MVKDQHRPTANTFLKMWHSAVRPRSPSECEILDPQLPPLAIQQHSESTGVEIVHLSFVEIEFN